MTIVILTDHDEIEIHATPSSDTPGPGPDPEPPPIFGSLIVGSSRLRAVAAFDPAIWTEDHMSRAMESLIDQGTAEFEADGATVLLRALD